VRIDTLLDVEQRPPPDQVEAIARQLEADYKTTVTHLSGEYLFAPSTPEVVRERVLRHATAMPPAISIALLRQSWAYDPLPALLEIKAPIRAVNAEKFPTNVEVNRRHMPGFEVVIVTGTGHYPMLEDPARFNSALDQALAQVLAPKP
jgi:sigma-B regulation protein RsbQ